MVAACASVLVAILLVPLATGNFDEDPEVLAPPPACSPGSNTA